MQPQPPGGDDQPTLITLSLAGIEWGGGAINIIRDRLSTDVSARARGKPLSLGRTSLESSIHWTVRDPTSTCNQRRDASDNIQQAAKFCTSWQYGS